ncbi:MAG: hypothetical protein K2X69_06015 [Silvanigrellaceae bacterium]|nr:hypothetical protein [Silvanigrellaceae bacterium]
MNNKYEEMGKFFKESLELAQISADNQELIWCKSNYSIILKGCGRMSAGALNDYGIPSLARLEGGDHLVFINTTGEGGAKHDAGVLAAFSYLSSKGLNLVLEDRRLS